MEAAFTIGSAISITLLGMLVVYNSSREAIRQWFFMFCIALSSWQVSFFLSEMRSEHALLFNRLTFIGPLLAVALFLFFIRQLESDALNRRKWFFSPELIIAATLAGVVSLLCLTPGVVSGIRDRLSDGTFQGYDIQRGSLYVVYTAVFLILIAMVIRALVLLRRTSNIRLRQRTNTIAAGVVLATTLGITTNFLLPFLLKTSEFSYLGSLAVLVLATVLSIAIARHKLINVQLLVARSFAYIASITCITLIYSLAVVFLIRRFIGGDLRIDTASQIVLGVIFIAGSLSYRPIKEWFDRLTNKLFYQDAYDSQEVIAKLNATIVSTINIESLLSQVSDTLVGSLKSQFCVFGLKETEHAPRRSIGDRHLALTEEELKIVRSATVHQHHRVILVEDTNEAAPELYRILKKYDVEALVRLVSAAGEGVEGVGYIALGAKKSGNPYSSQDIKLLEIVSSELAIAIQNVMQFEEIQQFNVILEERIEQATRKLQRTNEKLKALDETKDEFISMASHQLRTPLTSVKGYLSMVIEGDAGQITETQRKLLWQAFISSQRMVNLIADLLNVSRLRTGKFIIESTPTNLASIIAEEIDQLRETAQARELKLIFDKPKDFPVLMLDETKIRQVAMNFMDNAIYYTPPGGEIHVELKDTPTSIEFAVADNGIGVPKHEQPHLFTKFYRAGNARKARPDGTGLGLFMAKKVVMAQGGSILFHSKEGKGSTFGFTLAKQRLLPSAKAAGTQEITLNPEVIQP